MCPIVKRMRQSDSAIACSCHSMIVSGESVGQTRTHNWDSSFGHYILMRDFGLPPWAYLEPQIMTSRRNTTLLDLQTHLRFAARQTGHTKTTAIRTVKISQLQEEISLVRHISDTITSWIFTYISLGRIFTHGIGMKWWNDPGRALKYIALPTHASIFHTTLIGSKYFFLSL